MIPKVQVWTVVKTINVNINNKVRIDTNPNKWNFFNLMNLKKSDECPTLNSVI